MPWIQLFSLICHVVNPFLIGQCLKIFYENIIVILEAGKKVAHKKGCKNYIFVANLGFACMVVVVNFR